LPGWKERTKLDTERFEELVARAIEELPEELRERLENVDIVVADEPSRAQRRAEHLGPRDTLLGLYEGVPLTNRTHGYDLVMPDKITIFQLPIEESCRSDKQIVNLVKRVVRHEIAHHFGISDERLRDIGRY
jgi:predicted Zn-dependent protease with MMP-like domain